MEGKDGKFFFDKKRVVKIKLGKQILAETKTRIREIVETLKYDCEY